MAPDLLKENHYATLGLPFGASEEEIRKAYLETMRLHHPDRCRETAESRARFLEVQAAWRCLSNSTRRLLYDLRNFGHSSVDGAQGPEAEAKLREQAKEQAELDLRNMEVELQRILQAERAKKGILVKQ
ncbi:unnamed protein product, partial [Effrenium voratum]